MKIIIFGGSFNPVHIGHMHLAETAAHQFGAEKVLFVPAFRPPHKQASSFVSSEHRIAMLKLAIKHTPWEIDDCEIKRTGVSFTIETLRELSGRLSFTEPPGFIVGSDLIDGFDNWKDPQLVAKEASLILATRDPLDEKRFKYPHKRLVNLCLEISSSDLRKRIKNRVPCRYLFPAGVYDYIVENRLYSDADA